MLAVACLIGSLQYDGNLRVQRFGLCEDCGVVCALVLLLRLAFFCGQRASPHSGFAELVPLFCVNVWTLDAYVTGSCCDLKIPWKLLSLRRCWTRSVVGLIGTL